MDAFDSDATNVMSRALHQALRRLKTFGLVVEDSAAARATLSKLIIEAAARGERDEEKLILFAIGRFKAGDTADI